MRVSAYERGRERDLLRARNMMIEGEQARERWNEIEGDGLVRREREAATTTRQRGREGRTHEHRGGD